MDETTRRQKLTIPGGRLRIVIDSDAKNEVDDQFAIAWALRSPERFQIEAVYAAPFSHTVFRHNIGDLISWFRKTQRKAWNRVMRK